MADHRHSKHAAPRRRSRRSVSLLTRAVLPTVGVLSVAVAGGAAILHEGSPVRTAAASTSASGAASVAKHKDVFAASASRGQVPATVSRSAERPPLPDVAAAKKKIEGLRYATGDIKIHADAKTSSPVLATVEDGDSVDITGETNGKWAQIVHNGVTRWVEAKALAVEEPMGTAPCPTGSGVERGLRPDTIKVYRAVCAKFPSIVSYGGMAGRGEHGTGQALDIMVSGDLGNEVAAYLQENRAELGIEYLIWRQRIWRPATSSAWRGMSDRGGATANHMDHVHVTTYGSSATR
ncbi:SH3 domain-containing protein [Aeromicrobium wangtongii]|uniref:SH3 domain-containing protein n=1 Tax=Aeromicrobium wangtongii TaxID=2969247 RepID=A0ABY5MDW7_9ACTN|nr:SH3 domain-containing protein [Aeromicrobium wangtongii]MCD9197631.1 SH3 domain-containing protein [Aeromicrobium wangtongii]UUP15119.1 SH3 domain-containing protein [Aeromicrobium wangtongii]